MQVDLLAEPPTSEEDDAQADMADAAAMAESRGAEPPTVMDPPMAEDPLEAIISGPADEAIIGELD